MGQNENIERANSHKRIEGMGHDRFERNENTGRTNSQRGGKLFLENDLVKTDLENPCVKNKPWGVSPRLKINLGACPLV